MKTIPVNQSEKPKLLGALNLLTLDLIFPSLPKIPALGEEVSTHSFEACLGGGPVASLVVASRLGAQTRLATHFGEDAMSQLVRGLLDKEGLTYHNFTGTRSSNPPVNITSVMTFEKKDRSFVSYFTESDFYAAGDDEKFEYLKDTRFCLASSPSPALFARLKNAGSRIIYDVGWDDEMDIRSLQPVLPHVYLFSPNSMEAMKLTGAENPQVALYKLAEHVEQPIVKLAKDGALVLHEGKAVHLPPADFNAVDSTGAGDAFLGGVAYGLLQGWDILRCVELGNFTGGNATTAVGCLTARCTLEDFNRYRQSHTG